MSYKHHLATGAAGIAETITPSSSFQIEEIRIHFNIAPAAASNVIVSVDHLNGPEYDIVIKTDDLNGVEDYVHQPVRPHQFPNGSKIIVTYANPSGRTYGLEVVIG